MKKKLLSWIMIFAMLLTLLPEAVPVYASATPSLGYRVAGWDEDTYTEFEDLSAPLQYEMESVYPNGLPVYFYFTDEKGVEHRLSGENLSSSDESIVTLWEADWDPGLFYVSFVGIGTAEINYTYNDIVYSIPVSVGLPALGFYSAPSATPENYIPYHTVTEANNTVYIIARYGLQITDVTLPEDFAAIAKFISIDKSGTVATVKITGIPIEDYYYEAYVDIMEPVSGECATEAVGITLSNGRPSLKFRWCDWDDIPVENTDYGFSVNYESIPGNNDYLFFYYTENGNEIRLTADDLTSSDESVIRISAAKENPDCVLVETVGFGEATIDFTDAAGTTYSVPVVCRLPLFGFYSSPTASEESFIKEFTVTNEQDTFYLVGNGSWTFPRVELNENLKEIATLTIDESGSFAAIKVTGVPNPDYWYYVYFDAENKENGEYWHDNGEQITLFNGKPSLMYRWPDWQGRPLENLDHHLSSSYRNAVGDTNPLFFYFVEGENETRLSVNDLTVSDENIVKISPFPENPDAVFVDLTGFGDATIDYTVDGITYSLPVSCELPTFGFYSSPIASEETYLKDFTVTEDCDTFYFVARNYWTFTRVDLTENFEKIANITLDESGTFAKIKVTGTANHDYGYSVNYDAVNHEYNDDIIDNGRSITLYNGKPALMYRWPDWVDGPVENTNEHLNSYYSNPPGDATLFFYFVDGENETLLTADDLVSSDENIIKISKHWENENAVLLEIVGFGDTTISYTVNGVTYHVDVTAELPPVGLYSTPFASEETYVRTFTVTEECDTFYLVGKDGWELTSVTLVDDLKDIATFSVSEDRTYAAIKVTGTPGANHWYNVDFDAVNYEYDSTMTNHSHGIQLNSYKPTMMFRECDWDNGPVENENYELRSSFQDAPGYSSTLFFYFMKNGKTHTLTANDLVSSDENIIKISAHPENPKAVRIESVNFGNASINYTVDGVTYSMDATISLPEFGFYTTPEATAESFIRDFRVTDTEKTFYFVATNGWTISEVSLDEMFESVADYELDESGRYVTIDVNGIPDSGRWHEISIVAYQQDGNRQRNHSNSICLTNAKTSLKYAWPNNDENEYDYLQERLFTSKGEHYDLLFFLVDGETNAETPILASDLVSSDESIVKIYENNQRVIIDVIGWGEAEVSYTDENGTTYSLPIISQLPMFGFYTTPYASEESYIANEFTLTDDNNTLYFIVHSDFVINHFEVEEHLAKIADVILSEDCTSLTITVHGDVNQDIYYGFYFEAAGIYGGYSNGNYGFRIVDNRTPEEPSVDVSEVFSDVSNSAWYKSAVQYVYDNGIMSGNNGLFNPAKAITRAQVVTTLYNMEGKPSVTDYSGVRDMIDVQAGQWYTDAVCWAYNVGVASGNSSTKMFNMNTPVTRQQLATFFYNYAKYRDFDITTRGDYSDLAGADQVASYAADTMKWAYGTGLITGSATTVNGVTIYDLKPTGTATRAQIASILQRFCENNGI